jgi:hypothetical protein
MKKKLRKELNKKGFTFTKESRIEVDEIETDDCGNYCARVYVYDIEKFMSDEGLLEKAKRDYPIGTVFKSIVSGCEFVSSGDFNSGHLVIFCRGEANGERFDACVHNALGGWAEIIKKPLLKIGEKFIYPGDEYFYIDKDDNYKLYKDKADIDLLGLSEDNECFRLFATREEAVEFMLEEAKVRFKGCVFCKFPHFYDYVKDSDLHTDNDCILSSYRGVWYAGKGWIAKPIKDLSSFTVEELKIIKERLGFHNEEESALYLKIKKLIDG